MALTFSRTVTSKTWNLINLIYIAQFDTNGILTALYIAIKCIRTQFFAHMDIRETIVFIHIIHVYTYIHTPTQVEYM